MKHSIVNGIIIAQKFKIARLEQALKDIYQECGKPTMSYAPSVENKERGQIIDRIVNLAKEVLGDIK